MKRTKTYDGGLLGFFHTICIGNIMTIDVPVY